MSSDQRKSFSRGWKIDPCGKRLRCLLPQAPGWSSVHTSEPLSLSCPVVLQEVTYRISALLLICEDSYLIFEASHSFTFFFLIDCCYVFKKSFSNYTFFVLSGTRSDWHFLAVWLLATFFTCLSPLLDSSNNRPHRVFGRSKHVLQIIANLLQISAQVLTLWLPPKPCLQWSLFPSPTLLSFLLSFLWLHRFH